MKNIYPLLVFVMFELVAALPSIIYVNAFAIEQEPPKAPASNLTTDPPTTTTLVIINHVNDTLGGKIKSSDFSMVIGNLNSTRTGNGLRITQTLDFINGTESGTILQLMPGQFFVRDNRMVSSSLTSGFNSTFSGNCGPFLTERGEKIALGNISAGQNITCHIDRTLLPTR